AAAAGAAAAAAAAVAGRSSASPSELTGVPEAGRDPIHGENDHLAERLALRPLRIREGAQPAQHLDLQIVERVDVRISQLDGALDDGLAVHQRAMPGEGEDGLAGTPMLRLDAGEERGRAGALGVEARIQGRDGEVGL